MPKPSKNHKFSKRPERQTLRKTFVIMTEGSKTEPEYFGLFAHPSLDVRVKRNKSDHSSAPQKVLQRMERYLEQNELGPNDEAWTVVDRNNWSEQQLEPLVAWAKQRNNCHLALSNPKFEYWLLLHFEDGKGVSSSGECDRRLKLRLPHYDKGINVRTFPPERIWEAVRRTRERDDSSSDDWPRTPGNTTVYRLVERLLQIIDPPA